MTALNTSTARVINPILTGIAQGYRHVQRVGHVRFPIVNVLQRGGKVIESGYGGKPCALSQFTLDTPVPAPRDIRV